jgi:hypothetical protein
MDGTYDSVLITLMIDKRSSVYSEHIYLKNKCNINLDDEHSSYSHWLPFTACFESQKTLEEGRKDAGKIKSSCHLPVLLPSQLVVLCFLAISRLLIFFQSGPMVWTGTHILKR